MSEIIAKSQDVRYADKKHWRSMLQLLLKFLEKEHRLPSHWDETNGNATMLVGAPIRNDDLAESNRNHYTSSNAFHRKYKNCVCQTKEGFFVKMPGALHWTAPGDDRGEKAMRVLFKIAKVKGITFTRP